MLGKIPTKEFP